MLRQTRTTDKQTDKGRASLCSQEVDHVMNVQQRDRKSNECCFSSVHCGMFSCTVCYLLTGPPPSFSSPPPPSLETAIVTSSPPHLLPQPHSGNMVASCLSWLLSQEYIKIEVEMNRNVYCICSNLCNVLIIGKQNFNSLIHPNPWNKWISNHSTERKSIFPTMFLARATNLFP